MVMKQSKEVKLPGPKRRSLLMSQEILIIDDSAFMRKIIQNILKKYGYVKFREADMGRLGLIEYEKKKAGVVVLDIVMPGMSGVQALKKFKELDPNVQVIMITAVGQEEIMNECDQIGIAGYITKPFKDEAVYYTIKGVIGPPQRGTKKINTKDRGVK